MDGIALEEVGKVDKVFAAFGVRIGDEFIVGEGQAEDVGIHYYDASWVGAVTDYVGIKAVDQFFFALGLAFVDGTLVLL